MKSNLFRFIVGQTHYSTYGHAKMSFDPQRTPTEFFAQSFTLPPSIHLKLTEHGRSLKTANPGPTVMLIWNFRHLISHVKFVDQIQEQNEAHVHAQAQAQAQAMAHAHAQAQAANQQAALQQAVANQVAMMEARQSQQGGPGLQQQMLYYPSQQQQIQSGQARAFHVSGTGCLEGFREHNEGWLWTLQRWLWLCC